MVAVGATPSSSSAKRQSLFLFSPSSQSAKERGQQKSWSSSVKRKTSVASRRLLSKDVESLLRAGELNTLAITKYNNNNNNDNDNDNDNNNYNYWCLPRFYIFEVI
jgi:hypothetical protein